MMPQFHETGYGQSFYRGQVPDLIDALKSISINLEKIHLGIEKLNESTSAIADVEANRVQDMDHLEQKK
jgi:hypothetical protein